jgi:hypothetical protein
MTIQTVREAAEALLDVLLGHSPMEQVEIMILAFAARDRALLADTFDNLVTALEKWCPDANAAIRAKVKSDDAALEEFLAFLRRPAPPSRS